MNLKREVEKVLKLLFLILIFTLFLINTLQSSNTRTIENTNSCFLESLWIFFQSNKGFRKVLESFYYSRIAY